MRAPVPTSPRRTPVPLERDRGPFRGRADPLRAAVLGAVQGPTELLPVSSSAHLRIVPWLLGWDLDRTVDPEDRKAFGGRGSLRGGAGAPDRSGGG